MKCPVCHASYRPPAVLCRRCGVDLSPLIRLYDQAVWHHRQAIELLKAGQYAAAIVQNDQAIALHHRQAEFHVLAGQLWALQGKTDRAIQCWRTAQSLDPQFLTAIADLNQG